MVDKIQWIKGLLGHGTPAEQAAVRNVRQHMLDTGNEKLIIGPTGGPADLSNTLSNTGGPRSVEWPSGHQQWNQRMAAQGEPIYSAHAHPMRSTVVPSQGDLANWAKDYYVTDLKKQGTYVAPDKYARENMWIAGAKDPNLVSLMPPLEYGKYADTYETLRKIKDADAKYKMNLYKDQATGKWPMGATTFSVDFQDFAKPWLKKLSPEQQSEAYGNMAHGLLANKLAEAAPLFMDPKGTLVRGHDLPIGDLWPEFQKYVDKIGNPIFKAEGGQIEHFQHGGGKGGALVGGLQAMQDYATAIADIFKRPITVAAPDNVWARIRNDGRFKSQFETGTSEGTLSPRYRRATEHALWGIPEDSPMHLRPIYGHIADLSNLGSSSYGKWGAVLDPSVKARSTFFLDDSLNQNIGTRGPYKFFENDTKQNADLDQWMKKVLDPDYNNVNRGGGRPFEANEPRTAGRLNRAADIPYIETQTFGGLPFSDVRAMVNKNRVHAPDIASTNAQRIADTTGVPSFASWSKSVNQDPPIWMRATPGQYHSQVVEVPDTELKAFGYASGGSVPGYQTGSKVAEIARTLRRYKDAATTKIEDWPWHPLGGIAKKLPREMPEHVLNYGDFMRDFSKKVSLEGLDTRDALKAYLTTLSSMQRQAIGREALPGIRLSSPDRMIRPEGAYADWLGGKQGQKYLQYASEGEAHPEAIADAVQNMTPFGFQNLLGRQMTAAPKIVPGTEAKIAEQVDRARRGMSHPSEWADVTDAYEGIDAAKKGFFGSLIGYGGRPTLDARQINMHAIDPKLAENAMRRVGGGEEAVQRLADRQRALSFAAPPQYDPFYQHLAHHTIWDSTSGIPTTHSDLIDMMKNRAEGGQVGDPYDAIAEAQSLMGAYK